MNGKTFTVNAPLTGTFYRRPSPDDPPYVEEGDEIRVIDGPFNNFHGVVGEVKPDKEKRGVLISYLD